MSAWGTEMDSIITLIRGAAFILPAGADGATRGLFPAEELGKDEMPHLFIYAPSTVEVQADFLQRELRTTYQLEIWFEETLRDAHEASRSSKRSTAATCRPRRPARWPSST